MLKIVQAMPKKMACVERAIETEMSFENPKLAFSKILLASNRSLQGSLGVETSLILSTDDGADVS
jgi:hypothetical protein